MPHVEFIGPPGAGKSTFHTALTSVDGAFGGVDADGYRRLLLDVLDEPYRTFYRMLPSSLTTRIESIVLEHRCRERYFHQFVDRYPGVAETIAEILHQATREPIGALSYYQKICAEYELGRKMTASGELLCLDGGFGMLAVALRFRGVSVSFLDEFFEIHPVPTILIWVNTPPDTGLNRVQQRSKNILDKPWFSDVREAYRAHATYCEEVIQLLQRKSRLQIYRIDGSTDPERINYEIADVVTASID